MEDVQELIKKGGVHLGKSIDDTSKALIEWKPGTDGIYILGRKIDGFESLEDFLKYLDRFMELEEENAMLKKKLEAYENGR